MYSKVKRVVGLAQIQRANIIYKGQNRVIYNGVVDLVVDVEYEMARALRWRHTSATLPINATITVSTNLKGIVML